MCSFRVPTGLRSPVVSLDACAFWVGLGGRSHLDWNQEPQRPVGHHQGILSRVRPNGTMESHPSKGFLVLGAEKKVLHNTIVLSSSSGEFGAALESVGEDKDEEDGVTASQVAIQAADTEEAVRRYICSQPALHRKVLMYQPLELAELQAELKQNGIPVAMGKLLDILDAQCVTFTTAAARKEKLRQKRRQPSGRKKKDQK